MNKRDAQLVRPTEEQEKVVKKFLTRQFLKVAAFAGAGTFLRSPGGYLRGMVAKKKAQELHLDRTIWAWHRAS